MSYAELQVTTNFSFLRGASHPDELVEQAAALEYNCIAITDRNTVAGIVRAHVAARAKNIRMIVGCRLDLIDGASLLMYPTSQPGYTQLSALLTKGNLRAEKGSCILYKSDVYEHCGNNKFIVLPPDSLNNEFDFDISFHQTLKEYREIFKSDLYIRCHPPV